MSRDLTSETIVRLADLMARRKASPVEVAEGFLERIEGEGRRLNAVVTLAGDVLEQARAAERALAKGSGAGPLCGVPVTVKDTLDVRALRATAGSAARSERVAGADAPAVARLRAAGAVILGKTNCSELALDYTTENPVFGRTLNPHDLTRTPGGSSGGCAAAVAARLTAASLGSDLVGSIRIPAHFCGVVGFRPAGASVPRAGHTPPVVGVYALGASVGPLARTVADARLLYGVLSGEVDGGTHEGTVAGERLMARDGRGHLRGVRFCAYEEEGTVPVSDESRAAVGSAKRALEEAGLVAVEARPPHVESGAGLWLALISQATARFVREEFEGREELAGPVARAVMQRDAGGAGESSDELRAKLERREAMRARLLGWMETTRLLVAPVGAVAAFRHDEARRVEVAGQSVNTFRAFAHAQVFNFFDLPAIMVPVNRTKEGLPVGVQLAARPGDEALLFAAAGVVERAASAGRRPADNAPQRGANPL
jgi:amidase